MNPATLIVQIPLLTMITHSHNTGIAQKALLMLAAIIGGMALLLAA